MILINCNVEDEMHLNRVDGYSKRIQTLRIQIFLGTDILFDNDMIIAFKGNQAEMSSLKYMPYVYCILQITDGVSDVSRGFTRVCTR